MNRIIRATVLTNSVDDSMNRVKLQSPDIWKETPLVESVNGLYLRKGEVVFVRVDDNFSQPLIIGRACNWLDMKELANLFNSIIKVVNDNADIYNKLSNIVSACPTTAYDGGAAFKSALASSLAQPQNQMKHKDNIKYDDITHKQ